MPLPPTEPIAPPRARRRRSSRRFRPAGPGRIEALEGRITPTSGGMLPSTYVSLYSSPNNTSTFDDPVTLRATVGPIVDPPGVAPGPFNPTGTVSFYEGSLLLGTAPVVSTPSGFGATTATLTTAALELGTGPVTAVYGGDATHGAGTSNTLQLDAQLPTTVTVYDTIPAANPVLTVGEKFSLKVNLQYQLPDSVHTFDPPPWSGYVTFVAGDPAVAGGSVVLGTAEVGIGGTATLATSLSAGTNIPIRAYYTGDSYHAPTGSAPLALTVAPAPTATTLALPQSVATFGQSLTLRATVAALPPSTVAIPDGDTVSFYDGTTWLGTSRTSGGVATLTVSSLAPGAHSIKAVFTIVPVDPPGPSFSGLVVSGSTSATRTLTIVPASTYTRLTSSSATTAVGDPLTYTAIVYPFAPGVGTPAGSITFYDGNTPLGTTTLVGGRASLTLAATGPGQAHWVTAVYGGGIGFGRSSSDILFESVHPAPPTAVVLSAGVAPAILTAIPPAPAPAPAVPAGPASVVVLPTLQFNPTGVGLPTAVYPVGPGLPAPTGTLTFLLDGRVVGVQSLSGGTAGIYLARGAAQDRTLTILYSGDAHDKPGQSGPIFLSGSPWGGARRSSASG